MFFWNVEVTISRWKLALWLQMDKLIKEALRKALGIPWITLRNTEVDKGHLDIFGPRCSASLFLSCLLGSSKRTQLLVICLPICGEAKWHHKQRIHLQFYFQAVKTSLQDLCKALNGSSSSGTSLAGTARTQNWRVFFMRPTKHNCKAWPWHIWLLALCLHWKCILVSHVFHLSFMEHELSDVVSMQIQFG